MFPRAEFGTKWHLLRRRPAPGTGRLRASHPARTVGMPRIGEPLVAQIASFCAPPLDCTEEAALVHQAAPRAFSQTSLVTHGDTVHRRSAMRTSDSSPRD